MRMQQSELKQQSAFAKMGANLFLFVTDYIGRNGTIGCLLLEYLLDVSPLVT